MVLFMPPKPNPRLLVLRRDTATGLTHVGWESDLPLVRFEHLELIGESSENRLPGLESECYAAYQSALEQARAANRLMLARQVCENQAKGWYFVPFALANARQVLQADNVGNYAAAAIQLQYQLTHHCQQAWAIIQQRDVVHVRARYPQQALDELTYQVWYHKQLHDMKALGGTVLEGALMVCESGLWFEAKL